jgi:hypothetical protein
MMIATHLLLLVFIAIGSATYVSTSKIESVGVYFSLVYILFLGIWYCISYVEYRNESHTAPCSRRYALYMLIFNTR